MAATVAKRPTPRTVTVKLPEPFVGWEATILASFPFAILEDLQSGDFPRVCAAFDRIVLEHNFPDLEGNKAATSAEVSDYDAVAKTISMWAEASAALPPR